MKNLISKVLFLFILIASFSAANFASTVNVASVSVPNWRAGGALCSMRIYANGDFTDSLGVRYLGGAVGTLNYFHVVNGTVFNNFCTLEAFNLPSTSDAQTNNQVKYTAVLYDSKNTQRGVYLASFSLPISLGTSVTWAQIAVHNQATPRPSTTMVGYYTAPQVDALIQQNINATVQDATTVTKGGVRLSAPPVSPSNPVAVGTNDHFYTSQVQTRYADAFVSLDAAVAAIGAAKTKLVISSSEIVTSNLTLPRNVTLDFEAGGFLCPAINQTITIYSMRDPGNTQVFGCDGNVIIEQNAVIKFNLSWWVGADDSIDATKAIKNLMDSIGASGGGEALIPIGLWQTSETVVIPSNCTIIGSGNRFSGFRLTDKNKPLLQIQSILNVNVGDLLIKNLNLDADGVVGGKGLEITGTAPFSAWGITIEDVRFTGGTVGLDFRSTDNTWELQHLTINRGIFELNGIGFRSNSLNSDVHFEQPLFILPVGGTGIYIEAIGNLSVKNHNCFGSSTPVANVPAADNSTFLYLFGARNAINIEGGQDENIEYFMRTSTNAYLVGILTLKANLIQSKLRASANASVISHDNLYVYFAAGAYQNDSGAIFVVYSQNDALNGRNPDGSPNPNLKLANFTGTTSRLAKQENLTENTTKIGQFAEIRPGASLLGILQTTTPSFTNSVKPVLSVVGESTGAPLLELADNNGTSQFGYHFFRDTVGTYQTGWLVADGNQTGFKGFYFNAPMRIQGDTVSTLLASQTLTNKTLSGANNTFSNIPQSAITSLTGDLAAKSGLASPAFTGTPSGPTAAIGTNTTQLATTAFVQAHLPIGSASLDFPSIATVGQANLTITVTGAVLGDSCTVTPNGAPEAGLIWNCFVSAANTVTVRLSNITASAIDPAARSYKITLIK